MMPSTELSPIQYSENGPDGAANIVRTTGGGSKKGLCFVAAGCSLLYICVAALAVAQMWVFWQLQGVTYQVHQLQGQLKEQANKTEVVTQQVEEQKSLTIIQMAGTFTLLSCLITVFHMTSHLRNFYQPDIQRKIVAILWLSPLYGVASFVSLCWPSMHEYMMILKDFYEAYCIYQFLAFLISVLGRGDRETVIQVLTKHAKDGHLDKPFQFLYCLFHPKPDESDYAMASAVLLECQVLAMQFVFIKPITGITMFVIDIANTTTADYEDEQLSSSSSWWTYLLTAKFWIIVIQNISVFLAFTGLLRFYHAVRDDLAWCQPFSKFMTIKGVVFMTFWQGMLIFILVGMRGNNNNSDDNSQDKAIMIQNILICLEMLFFSLAHFCVFPADEWKDGYIPTKLPAPGMAFGDFAKDVGVVIQHTSRRRRRRSRLGSQGSAVSEDDDNADII